MAFLDRLRRRMAPVEERETLTDDLALALLTRASAPATAANPQELALAAVGARLYADALAAGRWEPARPRGVLGPSQRARIARALILHGEALWRITVDGGAVRLQEVSTWTLSGGPDPRSWVYRCTLPAPSEQKSRTVDVSAAGVLHFMREPTRETPWRGVSPLTAAASTSRLTAELEKLLADEASGPRAQLIPVPRDGGAAELATIRSDIGSAAGGTLLLESTSHGMGEGVSAAPRRDWVPARLGADPPAALVEALRACSSALLGAVGVPAALLSETDGTAAREGWRRFLFGSVFPMARLIEEEAAAKLTLDGEAAPSLSFQSLHASDIAGRARAFQSLTGGGMEKDEAARVAGVGP